MNNFIAAFASLSKRMNSARVDCISAQGVYNNLVAQRDLLMIRNIDKLEVGVWDVEGGHVAITDCLGVLEINYYGDPL